MQPRTRKWLIIGGVLKLVITATLIIVFLMLPSPNVNHRIVATTSGRDIAGYERSLLQLHESGAFNIVIIHEDIVYFSAIGRFDRSRDNLRLYFYEAWINTGGTLSRADLAGTHRNYDIDGGRIRFMLEHTSGVAYFRA